MVSNYYSEKQNKNNKKKERKEKRNNCLDAIKFGNNGNYC